MKLSTIITDLKNFDPHIYSKHEIGIEVQTFGQDKLDTDYQPLLLEWASKLKKFNEPISLHGSSFDLNPGSTDKKIIEVTRQRYLQSIDIAQKLGAKNVVFHSQVNPLLSVQHIRELKANNQIEFWRDLFKNYIPEDMNILLENEYDDTPEDMEKIVRTVNKENFGICFDTGHCLAYSNYGIEDWVKTMGDLIKYVHLHWNDGQADQHRKPSDHDFSQFKTLMTKYNISPVVTLEYKVENLGCEIKRLKSLI